MRYEFWVVRYVPDPVRGERVNIGVIAGANDDWAFRRVSNLRRASRLGGSATATSAFLDRIQESIDSQLQALQHQLIPSAQVERLSRGVVEDLRVRMNNVVQISPPRVVLAESAQDAADLAYDLMIVDVGHEVRHRSRTQVVHRLQRAFAREPEMDSHVVLSRRVVAGAQSTNVDVAVTDDITRQITQAWSFDIKDLHRLETNIQAWSYMMRRLRDDGGQLAHRGSRKGQIVSIPRDVDINVLFTPPTTNEGHRQLRVATEGWRRMDIDVLAESETENVVQEAKRLVMA